MPYRACRLQAHHLVHQQVSLVENLYSSVQARSDDEAIDALGAVCSGIPGCLLLTVGEPANGNGKAKVLSQGNDGDLRNGTVPRGCCDRPTNERTDVPRKRAKTKMEISVRDSLGSHSRVKQGIRQHLISLN